MESAFAAKSEEKKTAARPTTEPTTAGGTTHAEELGAPAGMPLFLQRQMDGQEAVEEEEKLAAAGVQAKLTVGAPDDPYEQEADQVAEQVMRMPESEEEETVSTSPLPISRVQRKCEACTAEEEQETLQRKEEGGAAVAAQPSLEARLHASKGTGQPLPEETRGFMESRFGQDFGEVRVHEGQESAQLNRDLRAQAFTHGQDVYFGAGKYSPASTVGKWLLSHELAHTLQQREDTLPKVYRNPDPEKPTLDDLIRSQPPGFTDSELDAAYQRYLRSETAAADPKTWALRQTVGRPRERLVRLLGPDYARGQRAGAARPPVDVSNITAPTGYDPSRQQQDLATLQSSGGALTARLGNLQYDPATGLQISAGHQAILQGNVGEVLARPLLDQALQEMRQTEPSAQLFLGVSAQLRMDDGSWTNPVQFTDGIIGVIDASGLRVLRVAEIKSGSEGGIQGQEQVHRWIEAHSTTGLRILLPGILRTFEYSSHIREVRNLTTASRMVIVPSDASFAGPRSGHGTTAPVIPIRLAQSSAEIAYLTAATAQRLLLESQARQIITAIQSRQLQPVEVASTLELQQYETIMRLRTQSRGLALVNGVLYRVGVGTEGRSLERLPVQPLQLPQGSGSTAPPPGGGAPSAMPSNALPSQAAPTTTSAGAGAPSMPLLPPGAPSTGSEPIHVPGLPGSAEVAPGTRIPTNVINVSGQNIMVGGGRVVPPSQPVELREGDIVVRGYSGRWAAMDARTGRPIAAVFEGGQFYTVARAGSVVSIEADGRISVSRTPELVPMTSEPVSTRAQSPGNTASPAMRGVAAGLGILVVVNEILGPIGRNLQQQRHNIAVGQAQIDFWAQFGGNPRHAVWVIGDQARAPEGVNADTSAFGSGSYPYVTAIDTGAFARVLPKRITNYRDYLLFLDMAKVLGTIVEEPTMPAFPSADERRTPRRYYAIVNAPDRNSRMQHDVTDIIVPLGARLLGTLDETMRQSLAALPEAQRRNVFRLKQGSGTPLFRSARGGQPILSDQQLLGDDPWVRTLGREMEGGFGSWFFHGQWGDRVLVVPANADAQRAAVVSAYVIKKTPDEVLEEVREGNRPIISRSPPDGSVVSFVAGPEPGESRFGETRYYRHPNWPNVRWTAAIGELRQFWVNTSDLEPVQLQDVNRYATRSPPR